MSPAAELLLDQAFALSSDERAWILLHLCDSVLQTDNSEMELAWKREIQKRIDQVERGEVEMIPWEEVKKKLERLRSK